MIISQPYCQALSNYFSLKAVSKVSCKERTRKELLFSIRCTYNIHGHVLALVEKMLMIKLQIRNMYSFTNVYRITKTKWKEDKK